MPYGTFRRLVVGPTSRLAQINHIPFPMHAIHRVGRYFFTVYGFRTLAPPHILRQAHGLPARFAWVRRQPNQAPPPDRTVLPNMRRKAHFADGGNAIH